MTDPVALIAEARAFTEKATPGPWVYDPEDGFRDVYIDEVGDGPMLLNDTGAGDYTHDDARFIAWARSSVPALADALETALAKVAAVEALADSLDPVYNTTPCDDPEPCCGSAEDCEATRYPSIGAVGATSIRKALRGAAGGEPT